jgi:hypothetical protein
LEVRWWLGFNPIKTPKEVTVMIGETKECGKLDALVREVEELWDALCEAQERGAAMHVVERDVVRAFILRAGRLALQAYVELCGTGDEGPVVVAPDGEELDRLPETKCRTYVSVFGPLEIERTVYSAGNHQWECAPLDARLGLPAGKFSFLVQDFAQLLGVELAWDKDHETLERILGIQVPVDSLERMNRHMAEGVTGYRQERVCPEVEAEGEIFVSSVDGKGVVMRQPRDESEPERSSIVPPETKGPKPGRKSMAVVGTLYSVDRYVRTPEEMLDILFRERPRPDEEPARPRPCGKHVWAALDDEAVADDGTEFRLEGLNTTLFWLSSEWQKRDPTHRKPLVRLMDGEHRLWEAADLHLPLGGHRDDADILDIMHVAGYLWKAASALESHREHQEAFFHERMGRILRGEVRGVVTGLRALATRRKLRGAKRKAVLNTCTYFEYHAERMRYDAYLRLGYPIASGAVEGACRHLIKDRLERTGMRWVRAGAQAMLNLRSLWINGEWDDYQAHYVEQELGRLYPNRKSLLKHQRRKLP